MMPGENQTKTGGIASEATSGTCQNCAVLNQTLDEYVAAFLALKQKIIDTNHILSEYRGKCDELQKSQRESGKLHKQLDEVLLKLAPLEKQNVDYETTKAELESIKTTLKSYQKKSEEADQLKNENVKILTLKVELENSLKNAEETTQKQSHENAQLKTEKKALGEELKRAQDALWTHQLAAQEMESLKLENAKTLILKGNLENQVIVLEDSKLKQKQELTTLIKEKARLEGSLFILQQKLEKLTRELCKEKWNASTQTEMEPRVDKARVKVLLDEIWHCMEPELSQNTKSLNYSGYSASLRAQHLSSPCKDVQLKRTPPKAVTSPLRGQVSDTLTQSPSAGVNHHALSSSKKRTPGASEAQTSKKDNSKTRPDNDKTRSTQSVEHTRIRNGIEESTGTVLLEKEDASSSGGGHWQIGFEMEEILDLFKPLPAAISPLPCPTVDLAGLQDDLFIDEEEKSRSNSESHKEHLDVIKSEHLVMNLQSPQEDMVVSPTDTSTNFYDKPKTHDMPSAPTEDMTVEDTSSEVKSGVNDSLCVHATQDLQNGFHLEHLSGDCDIELPSEAMTIHQNRCQSEPEVNTEISDSFKNSLKEPDPSRTDQELPKSTNYNPVIVKQSRPQEQFDLFSPTGDLNSVAVKNSDLHDSSGPEITKNTSLPKDNSVLETVASLDLTPKMSSEKVSEKSSIVVTDESHTPENFQENSKNLKAFPNEVGAEKQGQVCRKASEIESLAETDEDQHSRLLYGLPVDNTEDENESDGERLPVHEVPHPAKHNGVPIAGSPQDDESDQEYLGLQRKVRRSCSRPEPIVPSQSQHCAADHISPEESSNTEGIYSLEHSTTDKKSENETEIMRDSQNNQANLSQDKSSNCHDSVALLKLEDEEPQAMDSHEPSKGQKSDEQGEDCNSKELSMDTRNLSSITVSTTISSIVESQTSVIDSQDTCSPCVVISSKHAGKEKDLVISAKTFTTTSSPDSIGRVRTEMGPPLPPLVMPLSATPPRFISHTTPHRRRISLLQDAAEKSPLPTLSSPSCAVPSSPLQFGSATPKHAVPVPGRLPSSARSSPSPNASQESSMRMLDTMYPELSAQARTLNILRGNVNLGRAGSENGASPPSVNQISGNKTITSSSTAFTKTEQKAKRTGVDIHLPKSAKRLRLDNCSPGPSNIASPLEMANLQSVDEVEPSESQDEDTPLSIKEEQNDEECDIMKNKELIISEAIVKVCTSCFDLLPVIKSHVFLGRISETPVLRDEEKAVISEFCTKHESLASDFMSAILNKMKTERNALGGDQLQSLCRVHTGICRHGGDWQKAHTLAYSILKEDFPDVAKLILFMVTTWPSVLSHESTICKAIHTVTKLKAKGEILDCLTAYLHWKKNPPCEIQQMINNTVKALLADTHLKFQPQDRHGNDLCPTTWDYIFTVDLLCSHQKWKWTHDNIIGKELWPVMNTWVTQPRSHETPIKNISVAAVLRLIGRLSQQGIKEKLCTSVQNVAKAINLFCKHGITEGVPWEVQLSAVYAIYDLSPSNPKDALDALASWRGETTQPVPPAVTSYITQIGSLCRQVKS